MTQTCQLTSLGRTLDDSPAAFGWMTDSSEFLDRPDVLRQRLADEGYLYLAGCLDSSLVDRARERMLEQVSGLGMLDPNRPVSEGIARQPWEPRSCHALVRDNLPLQQVLYSGRMIELFTALLDGDVRHFDFTWVRAIGPGDGTAPHSDAVYMNRGTPRLYTAWTPLMEIPLDVGGLIVMPGSHRVERLQKYFDSDVDTYCENRPNRAPQDVHEWIGPVGDGKLSRYPDVLQQRLGLPWRTAEIYRPGDLVIFTLRTIHGSLDNTSDRLRLSVDSRYQRADEPADPRWIGPTPTGHGKSSRRGLIC